MDIERYIVVTRPYCKETGSPICEPFFSEISTEDEIYKGKSSDEIKATFERESLGDLNNPGIVLRVDRFLRLGEGNL